MYMVDVSGKIVELNGRSYFSIEPDRERKDKFGLVLINLDRTSNIVAAVFTVGTHNEVQEVRNRLLQELRTHNLLIDLAGESWLKLVPEPPFKPGRQVLYVPMHAQGDTDHPDCEQGFVTSYNPEDNTYFVRYFRQRSSADQAWELRTKANSERTDANNLVARSMLYPLTIQQAWAKYVSHADDTAFLDEILLEASK